ncbi:uncharacterized protein BHQ10_002861 [Talaromyces amestolkiae]|uniref:Translation elongation factor EF1B beta/delta subunit guanine nucleotide exchange domain-containing protein n=1 Tax=Talaromyces amestolkiae TaxID=1196081 RepID=A0A364KTI9_TALAM|nr:uncharacterized protein BHQ10_002861 [Talaromyces amestolkiae]RAO66849.1 hypothetical protein BHQ10_002861 [Talaromyces amestolkiae]
MLMKGHITMNSNDLVQQKYISEALKRQQLEWDAKPEALNTNANGHNERLQHLSDDPWIDYASLKSPIHSGDNVKFLVIGAGMGGILMAVRLIQAGFSAADIRIVDPAGGPGGTWYYNRYPGLYCDTDSYLYLPLLEATGYIPSQKYVSGVEIRKYITQIIDKWDLGGSFMFASKVEKLEWDTTTHLWKVNLRVQRGPKNYQDVTNVTFNVRFPIAALGRFRGAQVARVEGLAEFGGSLFHTARWDYSTTGGSPEESAPRMDKLKEKTVGIIGTGATAIQVVPELARYAKELFVFQRTPAAVYARNNRVTSDEDWSRIASGDSWQEARQDNMMGHLTNTFPPGTEDIVGDEWTSKRAYSAAIGGPRPEGVTRAEHVQDLYADSFRLDAESRSQLRTRVSNVVKDRSTAEQLTPWYPVWCKRPTFSDTYLQAFNEPHVHLVDTDGKGVRRASMKGLVVGETEYPLDVLVLSTGYESRVSSLNIESAGHFTVLGRGGRTMTEKFDVQGTTTLHGCCSNEFPNFFWIGASQTAAPVSYTQLSEIMCQHICYIITEAHKRAGDNVNFLIEPSIDAEEDWSVKIMNGALRFAAITACTQGTLNTAILDIQNDSISEVVKKRALLNTWVTTRSYIVSFTPTQADVSVFKVVTTAPDPAKYPHAARWYKHIASYESEFATLPGDPLKPYTTYGPDIIEDKTAATTSGDNDEEEEDLFGSDEEEEDPEAIRLREERLAAYKEKKAAKPQPSAKSIVTLEVKPWDDETDMDALEASVRSIEKDGLVWGASKLVAVGFGIKKLQINLVVQDEKVSTLDLQEEIEGFDEYVQSSDVVAMSKL